jgi:alpha-methylacyl-CoA racemase
VGPLDGIGVVEIASLGPGPFCAMVLADLGADVIRVDRAAAVAGGPGPLPDLLARGRRSVAVDLRQPDGVAAVLRLAASADVLIEGFRPGVAERLGIGPEACEGHNPRLVYGRMTGWGQDGPLAERAGHDIDYLAIAGALHPIGPAGGDPVPPLNLVADFGGGGMLLVAGILAALVERERSGRGQVVDAAMAEGVALLSTMFHELRAHGLWNEDRGTNLLDGGAPFYGVYRTADGGHMAVGAIEPQFYAELLERLGLDPADLPHQLDQERWPELRDRLAAVFATRSRGEWEQVFAGSDACAAPVLSLDEAPGHPHLQARGAFTMVDGMLQPAPAPRFGRTPAPAPGGAPSPGEHTNEILSGVGYSDEEIAALRQSGAVA